MCFIGSYSQKITILYPVEIIQELARLIVSFKNNIMRKSLMDIFGSAVFLFQCLSEYLYSYFSTQHLLALLLTIDKLHMISLENLVSRNLLSDPTLPFVLLFFYHIGNINKECKSKHLKSVSIQNQYINRCKT